MQQLFRANETRKFYEKVNQSRKGYVPQADSCRDTEGNLPTVQGEVLDRWRKFFNEHLNGDTANGDGVEAQLGAPDLQTIQEEFGKLKKKRREIS